jgi:uncharacterized protein
MTGLFAVFWLSFGMLQLPTLGLATPYSATGDAAEGLASKQYNAVVALYLIVWGFALLTFFIFTLKTNIVIAGIFFFVTIASWVLAGAYFNVASGNYARAGQCQTVCSQIVELRLSIEMLTRSRLEERCYSLWLAWAGICAS